MEVDKNCLSFWYPKIADAVRTPKTRILEMPNGVQQSIYEVFDGKPPGPLAEPWIKDILLPAVLEIGVPCFLRTGHTSGKHSWKDTCCVSSPDDLLRNVIRLIEFSECCGFIGLPWAKWAVREMLPTIPQFVADRYGDMPVVREFRFFVRDGKVECVHPYWPLEALRGGMSSPPPDLETQHHWLSYMPEVDREELYGTAMNAGIGVGGDYWSVDILDTKRGWFVTDMARGEESWHWPECKYGAAV